MQQVRLTLFLLGIFSVLWKFAALNAVSISQGNWDIHVTRNKKISVQHILHKNIYTLFSIAPEQAQFNLDTVYFDEKQPACCAQAFVDSVGISFGIYCDGELHQSQELELFVTEDYFAVVWNSSKVMVFTPSDEKPYKFKLPEGATNYYFEDDGMWIKLLNDRCLQTVYIPLFNPLVPYYSIAAGMYR